MTEEKDKNVDLDDEVDSDDEITQASPDEEIAEELKRGRADRIEDLEKKLKETEDKYLRAAAEFDNFRKRIQREKEEIAQSTSERLMKELLEVKDHLELALSHSQGAADVKSLRDGIDLTLKQLVNFLKKYGVDEVQPLGEAFDPAFHEAIHQEESPDYRPGSVVHVYQKGYVMKGRLLRPARVTVAADGSGQNLSDKPLSEKPLKEKK